MRQPLMVSVGGAVFVALIFSQSGPVGAQTDPLEGQTAEITDSRVGPIAVTDCEADPTATVSLTIADAEGEEETFTEGDNADFRFGSQGITITAPAGDNFTFPRGFDIGTGTVVESAGITCGNATGGNGGNGGGAGGSGARNVNPAADQYERNNVILETVPKKPLPKTGGTSLVLGGGVLLAFATFLSIRVLRP